MSEELPRHERYAKRLDEHLPTLADDKARLAFLDDQHCGFRDRYREFLRTNGRGTTATDFDYALTLAEIDIRRGHIMSKKG